MKKTLFFLILLDLIVIISLGLYLQNRLNNITWLGFYYKNAVYPTDIISQQKMLDEAPRFSSIQACINWGKDLLSKNQGDGFECSFGCRYEKSWESIVCKDTTKMITNIKKEGVWGD